jgi:hypothetical protein
MKLINDYSLSRRLRDDLFGMNVGILPGPASFHKVIIISEANSEGNSNTWARVHSKVRIRYSLERKMYSTAIADEWRNLETQWFRLRLLLGSDGTRRRQNNHANKRKKYLP